MGKHTNIAQGEHAQREGLRGEIVLMIYITA